MVNAIVPKKYPEEFKYLRKSCRLNCDIDLNALLNLKFTVKALGVLNASMTVWIIYVLVFYKKMGIISILNKDA